MLNILICEDSPAQRMRIESIANKHILSEDAYMDIALTADCPSALLDYIEKHNIQSGLYFLDVDLQSDINGIELAAKIKKLDVSATIVFITTHSELVHYAFRLKVEAMDYITKDSPPEEIEKRVIECMKTAYRRFLDGRHAKSKYFTVKIGNQILNIPYDDILFFESSTTLRHQVILHKADSTLAFRNYINDVSNLGPPFFRCHQSFVVNLNYIQRVDKFAREVEMTGGAIIPVAVRKMTELLKCLRSSGH